MIAALVSLAVVLLSAPTVAVRFTRGVHPQDWTRWSLAALVVGAVAAEAALVLCSLPTVLRALGAHALLAACARMTGSLMPGGPVVGWSVLSVATLGPVAVAFILGGSFAVVGSLVLRNVDTLTRVSGFGIIAMGLTNLGLLQLPFHPSRPLLRGPRPPIHRARHLNAPRQSVARLVAATCAHDRTRRRLGHGGRRRVVCDRPLAGVVPTIATVLRPTGLAPDPKERSL